MNHSTYDLASPALPRARHESPRLAAGTALPLAAIVAVAGVANGLLLAPVPAEMRFFGGLGLFVLLPGYLFVANVFRTRPTAALEYWLLTIGCGYVLATCLALALHGQLRPLSTAQILVGANLVNGALLITAVLRRAQLRLHLSRPSWTLLLLLAIAAPLRLLELDYSEFQGDEARVVLRGMAVLQGMPDALLVHRKPAGEILLQALFSGGTGAVTELSSRLPFATAGVVAVLALYGLGRALFGHRAGLAAGLLLAVNGYFVAFGRILQYQSIALLLDVLAILCLFRFARRPTSLGYGVAGSLLCLGSALTAVSAVFLLPVAALALWQPLLRSKRASGRAFAAWLWPLALLPLAAGLVLLAAGRAVPVGGTFNTARAWGYLASRLGENRPYFNLDALLLSANHYLSSLYLLVVVGSACSIALWALYDTLKQHGRPRRTAVSAHSPAFAAVALDTSKLGPMVLLGGAVALLVGFARRSIAWKLALLWAVGPLFAHLFLVRDPGTHWRESFPGMLLLVGAAAAGLYSRLATAPARSTALLLASLFLAGTAHYTYVAWVQTWPEYQTTYPANRHPLDWSGRRTRSSSVGGVFGAAHNDGWKAVAVLAADGQLPESQATNDSRARVSWYLKQPLLCREAAQLFIRAPSSAGERRAIEQGETLPGFTLAGRVFVGGRPTLALLTRDRSSSDPDEYQAEQYTRRFDQQLSSPWIPVGRHYLPAEDNPPGCPDDPREDRSG